PASDGTATADRPGRPRRAARHRRASGHRPRPAVRPTTAAADDGGRRQARQEVGRGVLHVALIRSERGDGLLLLGLDRPEKRNALDEAMVAEIEEALRLAHAGPPAILVVHSTTPGMFVSGADIAELIERDADAALRAINAGLF